MTPKDTPLVDAAALTALARSRYGPEGRLPVPDMTDWDIFPFEGELLVKPLADPVIPEPPRHGESQANCGACSALDSDYLWTNESWRLKTLAEPQPVPALLLEPRAHLDLGDLDEATAADMGVWILRIERALAAVPGIGRVHVNRWGDGGAHLRIWFFGRPEGMVQLRGSCLPDWLDVLPPMPADDWHEVMQRVVASLS